MTDSEKLLDILMDELPDKHPWEGEIRKLRDRLIANGVTFDKDINVQTKWISVKDRLPEESGMYIVTANDGHAQRVSFVLWQKKNRMWNLTGARSYWRITHWQPMPQPPKGERDND